MKTLLLLCVLSTLVVFCVSATAEQKSKNCNDVRAAYSSKGFNVNDVPNKGVNGKVEMLSNFLLVLFKNSAMKEWFSIWESGPVMGHRGLLVVQWLLSC